MALQSVRDAMHPLRTGERPGIDNIPAKLLKYGGPETEKFNYLPESMHYKAGLKYWTQFLIILLTKGYQKICKNYRTISVIS